MAFDVFSVVKQSFVRLFTDPFIFILAIIYAVGGGLFGFSESLAQLPSTTSVGEALLMNYLAYLGSISVYIILFLVFTFFVQELVFIRIYSNVKGIKKILGIAVRRFPYFIATNILTGIIVGLGFIAFIIPGIYLTFKLLLAPISSVTENKSPLDALKRSWGLSNGNWWYLFVLFIIQGIIVDIFGLIPYFSYFIDILLIIVYPLVFLQLAPKSKNRRKASSVL